MQVPGPVYIWGRLGETLITREQAGAQFAVGVIVGQVLLLVLDFTHHILSFLVLRAAAKPKR